MSACFAPRSKDVRRPAVCAETNASVMRHTMSTAGSAPKAAAGATRLAALFSRHWADAGPVHPVERSHIRETLPESCCVTRAGRGGSCRAVPHVDRQAARRRLQRPTRPQYAVAPGRNTGPSPADLAPQRSESGIGRAEAARSGQSVLVAHFACRSAALEATRISKVTSV